MAGAHRHRPHSAHDACQQNHHEQAHALHWVTCCTTPDESPHCDPKVWIDVHQLYCPLNQVARCQHAHALLARDPHRFHACFHHLFSFSEQRPGLFALW